MQEHQRELKQALRVIKTHCLAINPLMSNCRDCELYSFCKTDPYSWDIKTVDFELSCVHEKHCSAVVLAETAKDEALSKLKRQITDNEILRVQRDFLEKTLDNLCPDWKLKCVEDDAK